MDQYIPATLMPWVPFIENVLKAVVILVLGWIASRWAYKLARRALSFRKIDQAIGGVIATLLQYVVLAAALLSSLESVGVRTTSLTVVFGAVGLVVASAWTGSLGNIASGVLLLFFRPFDLQHKVTVAGQTGVVQDIGLFATTLLTSDNEVIIVPNGEITKAAIVNFSAKGTLRGRVNIEVKYGNDVDKLVELLKRTAKGVANVEAEPGTDVSFNGLGPRGLELHVYFWAKAGAFPGVVHDVRNAVYSAMRSEGIEIPLSNVIIASNPG